MFARALEPFQVDTSSLDDLIRAKEEVSEGEGTDSLFQDLLDKHNAMERTGTLTPLVHLAIVVYFIRNLCRAKGTLERERPYMGSLVVPFRDECWWWFMVVLAQMEIDTVAQAFDVDPKATKSVQLAMCVLVLIATRLHVRPFANALLLRLGTASLLLQIRRLSCAYTSGLVRLFTDGERSPEDAKSSVAAVVDIGIPLLLMSVVVSHSLYQFREEKVFGFVRIKCTKVKVSEDNTSKTPPGAASAVKPPSLIEIEIAGDEGPDLSPIPG
jgi:hypothetical protein